MKIKLYATILALFALNSFADEVKPEEIKVEATTVAKSYELNGGQKSGDVYDITKDPRVEIPSELVYVPKGELNQIQKDLAELKEKKNCGNCCKDKQKAKITKKTSKSVSRKQVKRVEVKQSPKPVLKQAKPVIVQQVKPKPNVKRNIQPAKRTVVKREAKKPVAKRRYYHDHNHISAYGHVGFLTKVQNFTGEVEFRDQQIGLGLFGENLAVMDRTKNCSILDGNHFGLSLRYHLFPYWYTHFKRSFDPSIYGQVGYGRFNYLEDNRSFSGLTLGAGLDVAYPISSYVNLYGKTGINYVKDGSQLFYAGESLSFGLRLDFH